MIYDRHIFYPAEIAQKVDELEQLIRAGASDKIWEREDVSPIRRTIKAKYIVHQCRLCCYCKQVAKSKNFKVWEVEHILPQSVFPEFTFEPKNLAVACPDCNTFKGNKSISKSPKYRSFPSKPISYTIIHPNFDKYDDHLHNVGYIYIPKTPKGSRTIEVCRLFRFSEQFIDWENPVDEAAVDSAIADILTAGVNGDKLKKILKFAATI
jgi:5-methylcytosine-specific restriction endonuclease McrA